MDAGSGGGSCSHCSDTEDIRVACFGLLYSRVWLIIYQDYTCDWVYLGVVRKVASW